MVLLLCFIMFWTFVYWVHGFHDAAVVRDGKHDKVEVARWHIADAIMFVPIHIIVALYFSSTLQGLIILTLLSGAIRFLVHNVAYKIGVNTPLGNYSAVNGWYDVFDKLLLFVRDHAGINQYVFQILLIAVLSALYLIF